MAHTHRVESHRVEARHGASGSASVFAEIGGDVGAAVVYTQADLLGHEIEIRAADREWDGTHTAVRERHVNGATLWAGFFGSLPAGHYEVRVRGHGGPTQALEVRGGHVAEAQWG